MGRNGTIALAVLNAGLLAFILLYERGTLSTSETAERSGQVLTAFVREQVERVEVVPAEGPAIVLVRERAEDPEEGALDLGSWRLAAPVEAEADQDAVDSLLGALQWLTAQRTLGSVDAEDRARFGLSEPRYTVRFQVRAQQVEVAFGGEAPTGDGVYVAVADEARAHVVDDEILDELGHDLSHFRSKDLFDGYFAANTGEMSLRGGGGAFTLARREGRWRVTEPVRGWARASVVDGLLRVLRRARVARFVEEAPEDLAEYGLDAPWRELVAQRREGEGGEASARLRVGDPCGEHDGERYAVAGDEGPVVCVSNEDLAGVEEPDLEGLREPRLLPVADDAIEKLVVERDGARIELRRDEEAWRMVVGDEEREADDAAIAEWTRSLRAAEAQEFAPLEPGRGTEEARARITVHRSDEDGTLTLRLGEREGEGVWLRRGDEAALARFDASVEALFEVSSLRFREREALTLEPGAAARIVTSIGERRERAVKRDGAWQLEAPVEAEADPAVVGELLRRLAPLRAVRWVTSSPAAEHGLGEGDRVEVTSGDAVVSLTLGARTEGGRYARVDGPVFVVGDEDFEALTAPLVSRDVLGVPAEELARVELARDGGEVHALVRRDDGWTLDGADAAEAAAGLLERLDSLRAAGIVAYGPAGQELSTRVTLTSRDGEVTQLALGSTEGEGGEAFVPARRSGLDVTYRLRPEAARAIRDWRP